MAVVPGLARDWSPSGRSASSECQVRPGYPTRAKLEIAAAICSDAAVRTGPSGLRGTTPTCCASASAAIFFAPVIQRYNRVDAPRCPRVDKVEHTTLIERVVADVEAELAAVEHGERG